MSLQINIDGKPENSKLTDAQRRKEERDEKNTFIVDEAIKEQDTGYQHLGELAPRREADGTLSVMATQEMLESDLDAARERHAQNKPVIPVWYFEDEHGETHFFLSYDDAQMAQQGYICFDVDTGIGCLARQKSTDSRICDPISSPSCGRRKNVI